MKRSDILFLLLCAICIAAFLILPKEIKEIGLIYKGF